MSEEEKEAIEWLERVVIDKQEYIKTYAWVGTRTLDNIEIALNLIQEQQAELTEKDREIEKKDKITNEMSNAMAKIHCGIADVIEEEICDKKCIGNNDWHCETCIKQYFEKKEKNNVIK